jgi:tetratricopeptide (TPR) repeat protein
VTAVATAAALLLSLGGFALAGAQGRLSRTQARLETTQARDRLAAHEAGTLRAVLLVHTANDRLHEHLRQGLRVCEETLDLYGVLDGGRLDGHPDWRLLGADERRRVAEQTQELLLLLAGARARLAPGDQETLRQALGLLDLAGALPGLPPARALHEDRAAYLDGLGEPSAARVERERAETIEPATARDFYVLALALARAGRHAEAVARLDEALARNPKHYWSWLQRGICNQERKDYALAAADFGVCVGLWEDFAWGHFNRARALEFAGNREEAVRGYSRAVELDPGFALARVNRGLVRLELEQNAEALADLDRAAGPGRDDAFLHVGRGVALERLGRHAEADVAFAKAWPRAAGLPSDLRLRLRWTYGFAVVARRPAEARAAFDEVLREAPDHPEASYGRGLALERDGRAEQAIEDFGRAAQARPGFVEPRRFRAVLLARLGRGAEAVRDINWCLEREPAQGATLYAAACVSALLAERAERPGQARDLAAQALKLLHDAFAHGYGRDRAAADEDLAGLHDRPEFRHLLARGN